MLSIFFPKNKFILPQLLLVGIAISAASLKAAPMHQEGSDPLEKTSENQSRMSGEDRAAQARRAGELNEGDSDSSGNTARGGACAVADPSLNPTASSGKAAEGTAQQKKPAFSIEELTTLIQSIRLADDEYKVTQKSGSPILAFTEMEGVEPDFKKTMSIAAQASLKYPLIRTEEVIDAAKKLVQRCEAAAGHLVVTLPTKEVAKTFLEQLNSPGASLEEIPWTGSAERPPIYRLHFGVSSPVSMLAIMPLILEKVTRQFPGVIPELDLLYRGYQAPDGCGSDRQRVPSSLPFPGQAQRGGAHLGWDAINNHHSPTDKHGYATRAAVRIVAEADLAKKKIQLMDCRWLNENREGFYSDLLSSLYFALDHGAQKYICHWNFPEMEKRYALNRAFDRMRVQGGEIFSHPNQKVFEAGEEHSSSAESAVRNVSGSVAETPVKKTVQSPITKKEGAIEFQECNVAQPGYKGRVIVSRTNLKYPLIRFEEIRNPQGAVVGQSEMAADHFLLKLPAGETPTTFLEKLAIPTARLEEVPWSEGPLYRFYFDADELGIPHVAALSTIAEAVSQKFPTAAPEMDLLYRGRGEPDSGYTKYWTTLQEERGDAGMPPLSKASMTLSVLGTGINPNFKGIRAWRDSQQSDAYGWNAIDNNFFPRDDHGHGTQEAAIIAKETVSIADRVELLACKWLNARREGFYSDAISSVYFAVRRGASILNCNWVFPDMKERVFLLDALKYAGLVDSKINKKSAMVVLDVSAVGKSEAHTVNTASQEQPATADPVRRSAQETSSELSKLSILETGLENGGNDCFMNASLQLVKGLALQAPTDMLILEKFFNNEPSFNARALRRELASKIMMGRQEFDEGFGDTVENISSFGFSWVQKDAGAFLSLLLRKMDVVPLCFSEQLTHPQTGEVRTVREGVQYTILPLTLPPVKQEGGLLILQEIFDRSLSSIAHGYDWREKDPSSRVDAPKKMQLSDPMPSFFVASIGRYDFQEGAALKRQDVIQGLLDNVALTKENGEHVFYQVNAIVCHLGGMLNTGHYICYRKEGEKWFRFDDDQVDEVEMKDETYAEVCKNCYLISLAKCDLAAHDE